VRRPRVALAHDWLTGMRGGEKVLEVLCGLLPDAPIYTMLHVPGSVSPLIENRPIYTSGLQRFPGTARNYRYYLPLMPWAVRDLNPGRYDLVLSISHCVAKSIRTPRGVPHVCYCNTPMRYVWDQFDQYFGPHRSGRLTRLAMGALAPWLRWWDRRTADRVTHFIGNSENVRERIQRIYGRQADVIYPPVDCDAYRPTGGPVGDYYLCVSAMAPYKRLDLAIEAFNRLGRKLVVIGGGQDASRLQSRSRDNIVWLGWQPESALREHYSACRAFIFPGEEDFGITPLEAMACGRPVIAYGAGGALETVVGLSDGEPSPTGLFFREQSVDALCDAVETFERHAEAFRPEAARGRARQFDTEVCRQRFSELIERWS